MTQFSLKITSFARVIGFSTTNNVRVGSILFSIHQKVPTRSANFCVEGDASIHSVTSYNLKRVKDPSIGMSYLQNQVESEVMKVKTVFLCDLSIFRK